MAGSKRTRGGVGAVITARDGILVMDFAICILLPLKIGLRKFLVPVWILNFGQRRLATLATSRLRKRACFRGQDKRLANAHLWLALRRATSI